MHYIQNEKFKCNERFELQVSYETIIFYLTNTLKI